MNELTEEQKVAIDERIDKFLRGLMTAEEEDAFKKDIANDPYIRRRAKEHTLLVKGVKQFGKSEDYAVINAVIASKQQKAKVISLTSKRSITVYAIAAVCLCLFVNKYIIDKSSLTYGVSESSSLISGMDSGMRSTSDTKTIAELKQLFVNAQNNTDIDNTIVKLQQYYDVSRNENVDEIDDYSSRIGWFLAVAYLNNGDKDKAKTTLNQVITDNPNADNAKELLKKLDRTFFWQ